MDCCCINTAFPYWLVARVCGHDEMFWERLVLRLGRNSVVGTTIKDPTQLPQDVLQMRSIRA